MRHFKILPCGVYHVYNRGNQKMNLFLDEDDYMKFRYKMFKYADEFKVKIVAYCLMPNHFHLLSQEPEKTSTKWAGIAHVLHRLQSSYAMYFCKKKENYSGHVFQGAYKIKCIHGEKYFLSVLDYIHQNPVRKNLVEKAEDWPYSSSRNFKAEP